VGDGGRGYVGDGVVDAVFVPAHASCFDRVAQASLIGRELGFAGFDLDEDNLADVLVVHAFEDEEVDWLADEACFRGFQIFREVRQKRRYLFGEHAAEYGARELLRFPLELGLDLFAFEDAEEEDDGTCEERGNGDEEEPEEGSWIDDGSMYKKCTRSSSSGRKTPPAGSGGPFRTDGLSSV
jgi:hypothetical protein